jgi:hypothetical protein
MDKHIKSLMNPIQGIISCGGDAIGSSEDDYSDSESDNRYNKDGDTDKNRDIENIEEPDEYSLK